MVLRLTCIFLGSLTYIVVSPLNINYTSKCWVLSTQEKKQRGNQHLQAPFDEDSDSCVKSNRLSRKEIPDVLLSALIYTSPPLQSAYRINQGRLYS